MVAVATQIEVGPWAVGGRAGGGRGWGRVDGELFACITVW